MAVYFKLAFTRFGYSSLNPKIAEGSIPIKGVSFEMSVLKSLIFSVAIALASFKNPFEIYALALSGWFGMFTVYPNLFNSLTALIPMSRS